MLPIKIKVDIHDQKIHDKIYAKFSENKCKSFEPIDVTSVDPVRAS